MRGQTSTVGSRRLFGIVSNGFLIGGLDIKKKKASVGGIRWAKFIDARTREHAQTGKAVQTHD